MKFALALVLVMTSSQLVFAQELQKGYPEDYKDIAVTGTAITATSGGIALGVDKKAQVEAAQAQRQIDQESLNHTRHQLNELEKRGVVTDGKIDLQQWRKLKAETYEKEKLLEKSVKRESKLAGELRAIRVATFVGAAAVANGLVNYLKFSREAEQGVNEAKVKSVPAGLTEEAAEAGASLGGVSTAAQAR